MIVARNLLFFILLANMSIPLIGQDNMRTYSFKAGEVIDILLLNQNPESDSLAKIYFETAIPIALKNGYKPNKGFTVKNYPLQGNYHPQAVVVASWPSEDIRKNCLVQLEQEVSLFHYMRRAIWTNFNVTYYPLQQDLSFSVDMDQYIVASAYWENDESDMTEFVNELIIKTESSGGKVVVNLQHGKSTFGYKYQPDYFIISSWDNQQQFEAFKKVNLQMDHAEVEQVHQFRIQ